MMLATGTSDNVSICLEHKRFPAEGVLLTASPGLWSSTSRPYALSDTF